MLRINKLTLLLIITILLNNLQFVHVSQLCLKLSKLSRTIFIRVHFPKHEITKTWKCEIHELTFPNKNAT